MVDGVGALGIPEFCKWAGIGRTKVYDEIGSGRLAIVKVGKRTLIRVSDAERWLSSLPSKVQMPTLSTRHDR
jgi:excisionase family DNA binding protein